MAVNFLQQIVKQAIERDFFTLREQKEEKNLSKDFKAKVSQSIDENAS